MSRSLAALVSLWGLTGCLTPVDEGPLDGSVQVQSDGGADSGSADAGRPFIRIATFNVRRLFDTECESGQCNAGDFEEVYTPTDFEAKVTQLAAGIRQLDADIVVLQEIENQTCMDALNAKLGDVFPASSLGETGSAGSVDVAVLSRAPISKTVRYRMTPIPRADGSLTAFSREFYEVHSTILGREVIAFAAHFRSKSNDDPSRRLAEAVAAQSIVSKVASENLSSLVVLAGDLNDTPGSDPINALETDDLLYRVARDIPVSEQATYFFNGSGQAIDHVFHAVKAAGAPVPKSTRVVRGTTGYAGSDHCALVTDFKP